MCGGSGGDSRSLDNHKNFQAFDMQPCLPTHSVFIGSVEAVNT